MKTLLLSILAYCLIAASAVAAPTRLQAGSGAQGSVDGVVVENVLDCRRDLSCYLRLEVGAPGGATPDAKTSRAAGARAASGAASPSTMSVRVIYHPGEGAPCASEAPPRTGQAITPGQRIHASGRYRLAAGVHLIDVCSSPADTLTVVP